MRFLLVIVALLCSFPAFAGLPPEVAYVINTFVILFSAALIMWMAVGFCMLESGLVRSKNTGVICLKNTVIYSIACFCFYILGYNLMFLDVGGWIGSFTLLANMKSAEFALFSGETQNGLLRVLKDDYSSMAFIFFQTTFVATAASVISGTVAERVRLWPFFIFVAILTTFIYPIQGSWSWGGGWLAELGFSDFAGSTVVHSVGGWAALTGAFFLGPRKDKYEGKGGAVKNYFPPNISLVTLGVFILWFGWLGFNGGSLLVTAGVSEMSKMALIFMNTNMASCAGAICTLLLTHFLYGKINLLLVLNGALAGLVSITAGPDFYQPLYAILVGGIGSCLATLSVPLLEKFKIDDVVGAIPVHLVAGIWGTLAVGIWGPAPFVAQLIGVISIGAFVCVTSGITWFILKKTMGIRVSHDFEEIGQDLLELGLEPQSHALDLEI